MKHFSREISFIMSKTEKRKVGDVGESVVTKYLVSRGYSILDRNYLRPWGELDIVAEKNNLIRFVEVKSVTQETKEQIISRETFRPEENLHVAKLKRLHRAIQTYLMDKRIPEDKPWQIDLACVFLDFKKRRAKVEMIENIII
jgi:putative endonuclease